jgi:D-glycero-D-manno-heptose 1,7-bisphosphate phosphatase
MINHRINQSWTLFLDRDGVINKKRENDYVKNWQDFHFLDGVLEAISILALKFNRIIIVTNQRGVGKGVMTLNDLFDIHSHMIEEISSNSGRIDKIYFCTDVSDDSFYRKPNIGMALTAKIEFPIINFSKSIMVGDSMSDMHFADNLGMYKVFISEDKNIVSSTNYDFCFTSLLAFSSFKI